MLIGIIFGIFASLAESEGELIRPRTGAQRRSEVPSPKPSYASHKQQWPTATPRLATGGRARRQTRHNLPIRRPKRQTQRKRQTDFGRLTYNPALSRGRPLHDLQSGSESISVVIFQQILGRVRVSGENGIEHTLVLLFDIFATIGKHGKLTTQVFVVDDRVQKQKVPGVGVRDHRLIIAVGNCAPG